GEVWFRDTWHPGSFKAIVDLTTFNRVQKILGTRIHRKSNITFGGKLIKCAECGHMLTGERIAKKLANGAVHFHYYYRCSQLNRSPHKTRGRINETELLAQLYEHLKTLKISDSNIQKWIIDVMQASAAGTKKEQKIRSARIQAELTKVHAMKNELLELRLRGEFDPSTCASKMIELKEKESNLLMDLNHCGVQQSEKIDLALKVFELSQHLETKWLNAELLEKRKLVEMLCLNLTLDGATLYPTWRKPFDVLASGAISKDGSGDRI
ncbi:MAG: recombinase zinc beta ribbon domain-containing protein, partial [Planctomycetota bacterium]